MIWLTRLVWNTQSVAWSTCCNVLLWNSNVLTEWGKKSPTKMLFFLTREIWGKELTRTLFPWLHWKSFSPILMYIILYRVSKLGKGDLTPAEWPQVLISCIKDFTTLKICRNVKIFTETYHWCIEFLHSIVCITLETSFICFLCQTILMCNLIKEWYASWGGIHYQKRIRAEMHINSRTQRFYLFFINPICT